MKRKITSVNVHCCSIVNLNTTYMLFLPSIASSPVLIGFHHLAIVLLQRQVERNHQNRESFNRKTKNHSSHECDEKYFICYLFITRSRIWSAIATACGVLLQLNVLCNDKLKTNYSPFVSHCSGFLLVRTGGILSSWCRWCLFVLGNVENASQFRVHQLFWFDFAPLSKQQNQKWINPIS